MNQPGVFVATSSSKGVRDEYCQLLRGIAIAAVVLIHCLGNGAPSFLLRPFLNFAVALFIFLSGFLTNPDGAVSSPSRFVRKRLMRVVPAYLIWSFIYILISGGAWSVAQVLKAILLGRAAVHLYFAVLYIQLSLLTPLLFRGIGSHPGILLAITPATLLLKSLFESLGIPTGLFGPFFGSWVLFYLLGMLSRANRLPLGWRGLGMLYLLGIILQFATGRYWLGLGRADIAVSQLRVASMVSSSAFVLLVIRMRGLFGRAPRREGLLVAIGDASFGIYLSHLALLQGLDLLLSNYPALPLFILIPFKFVLALAFSLLFVLLSRKVFPRDVCRVIGFG